MLQKLVDLTINESEEYINLVPYKRIVEKTIKEEVDALNCGKYIKVINFDTFRSDGIYIKMNNNELSAHIVIQSKKTKLDMPSDKIELLLAYSYIVKTVANMYDSKFKVIRVFTKKSDALISEYF